MNMGLIPYQKMDNDFGLEMLFTDVPYEKTIGTPLQDQNDGNAIQTEK